MTISLCCALSVDIDRFDDRYLRKHYGGVLILAGRPLTDPREIRMECSKARGHGLSVFPACHHINADGTCAGHAAGPGRVQRTRQKGRRMPEGAVCVSRPSRWGNPFVVRNDRDPWGRLSVVDRRADCIVAIVSEAVARSRAVSEYRSALLAGELPVTVEDVRRELRGKLLACWCKPGAPCHADVLLEVANGGAA